MNRNPDHIRPIGREGGVFSREFFTEAKAIVIQV
jgi:hypothetical protein